MNWNLWFSSFKTLTVSKPLHDAMEISLLQPLKVGHANEAILNFSNNSSMYRAALKDLVHRFGRPGNFVNRFFDNIRTFKVPNFQNSTSFMEHSTFVNNSVECLCHLGFDNCLNLTIDPRISSDRLLLNGHLRWKEYLVQNRIRRVTFRFQSMVSSISTSLLSHAKSKKIR